MMPIWRMVAANSGFTQAPLAVLPSVHTCWATAEDGKNANKQTLAINPAWTMRLMT
jgi:hypothetical protein